MSSTGRGAKGGGESEFFPTPAFPVRRLLERLALPGGAWLEPSAGDGAIIRAVARPDARWTAVELRPECRGSLMVTGAELVIGAFQQVALSWRGTRRFSVAILNPPFSQALSFARHCLEIADHVVLLERSPWIGDAEDRYNAFSSLMPDEYRVGRIDFDGRGGDSIPYSWFHWGPGDRRRRRGALELLDPTPAPERVPGTAPPARQQDLFG